MGEVFGRKWTDDLGVVIPLGSIVSAKLTYYDAENDADAALAVGGVISSRDAQEFIAAGAVVGGFNLTYAADPVDGIVKVLWTLQAGDTALLHPALDSELHGILFRVVTTGGGPWFDQCALRVLRVRRG